jgi:hypothetical protein
MHAAIRTANYIKTRPLKSRLYAGLCEEMGAQYQSLLLSVILVGRQEGRFWLVFTTCEK